MSNEKRIVDAKHIDLLVKEIIEWRSSCGTKGWYLMEANHIKRFIEQFISDNLEPLNEVLAEEKERHGKKSELLENFLYGVYLEKKHVSFLMTKGHQCDCLIKLQSIVDRCKNVISEIDPDFFKPYVPKNQPPKNY